MILTQFVLQNGHFALNVFAGLVFFAVTWLYLDAYFVTKSKKELIKILGFSLLSVSFLIHATHIEQAAISSLIFVNDFTEIIFDLVRFTAYILIIIGLIFDPIQQKPEYVSEDSKDQKEQVPASLAFFAQGLPVLLWNFSFPILSLTVLLLFLRRSTIGLEKHLRPLMVGFLFIFLYELFSLVKLFENTNVITIYKLVEPFGPFWLISHFFLLIGLAIIARWVFGYLLRRIQTELFMILNISMLAIFLVTTVCFTGLLLNNLRQDALSHLETDVNVAQYAIGLKQNQTLSDAELVSGNNEIINAVSTKDRKPLKELATSILLAKKASYLIIIASNGGVLMRGEDNEKVGDSLSNDSLFIKAMRGEKASSIIAKDGPIAPIVSIRSAVPIVSNGQTIGVAIVGTDIDNAFVDGLKSSTKLDVSVYGGNSLSATTFIAADGKSRFVGAKEEDKQINKKVLIEGKNYSLETSILNVPYLASFSPLKDISGNAVGMLFVGEEQILVIKAASNSIKDTFVIAVIFILLSIIPSFLVSRFITNQFK